MPTNSSAALPSPAALGHLLSSQIAGSRYIFPDLAPARAARWTLAMAGREECRPDYVVDRPSYPFHVIELIVRGSGRVRLGGGRWQRIGAGAIFSCDATAACRIETDPREPLVKYFFALHGRDVRARLQAVRLRPGVVRHTPILAEAIAAAEEVIREGQRHHPMTAEICLKLVELLLLRVATGSGPAQRPSDERARESFLRCKALIDDSAHVLQTLEAVADAVRLDPSTICRLFRRFQGISPYQYLMRRKMTLAAEHLLESGVLVKEAAARVGFQDPYHFSRSFKGVHGVSPDQLRRLAQGKRE